MARRTLGHTDGQDGFGLSRDINAILAHDYKDRFKLD
jgi:hypothetical protein